MQSQTQFTRPQSHHETAPASAFSEPFLGKLRLLARRIEAALT